MGFCVDPYGLVFLTACSPTSWKLSEINERYNNCTKQRSSRVSKTDKISDTKGG